jgi:60 kDa SS-A/Ro ribonucleoprotein
MNPHLFGPQLAERADTVNEAGGKAYSRDPKNDLATLACTGTFAGTFYADAESQLDRVLELAKKVDEDFLAKLAVYSRTKGYMKDMPAVLTALLAAKKSPWLRKVFPRVIDNGKMLRNFCQVIRSGVTGRRSFGTVPKALIREFLAEHDANWLFRNSYGQNPSMADVIKMVHPKPATWEHCALFAYLLGKEHAQTAATLPDLVQQFERFKDGDRTAVPNVPFPMIAGLDLSKETWAGIARNATWHSTRMNLNTFLRHGVLADKELVHTLAARLSSREEVQRARCFPYQLLMAHTAVSPEMPHELTEALQDAMEFAVENTPILEGDVYVCPDVSGSMSSAVTGNRKGATSKVACVHVAGLYAASIIRRNPRARVLPFDTAVYAPKVSGRDSIMTTARHLAEYGGGGTACSLPLAWMNQEKKNVDAVVYVSDNQSWADWARPAGRAYYGLRNQGAPAMAEEWAKLKKRNPQAKCVCIDIQSYATTQMAKRDDTLFVGGFSDQVFDVVASWLSASDESWTDKIENTEV